MLVRKATDIGSFPFQTRSARRRAIHQLALRVRPVSNGCGLDVPGVSGLVRRTPIARERCNRVLLWRWRRLGPASRASGSPTKPAIGGSCRRRRPGGRRCERGRGAFGPSGARRDASLETGTARSPIQNCRPDATGEVKRGLAPIGIDWNQPLGHGRARQRRSVNKKQKALAGAGGDLQRLLPDGNADTADRSAAQRPRPGCSISTIRRAPCRRRRNAVRPASNPLLAKPSDRRARVSRGRGQLGGDATERRTDRAPTAHRSEPPAERERSSGAVNCPDSSCVYRISTRPPLILDD